MKGFKHILIMGALLIAAMPCFHAHELEWHDHDGTAEAELCAAHACSCHACDEIPCAEDLEMPQERTIVSVAVATPPPSILLIVFSEQRHSVRQASPSVAGVLASLQTVQLLI
jgi:hypothetical protein